MSSNRSWLRSIISWTGILCWLLVIAIPAATLVFSIRPEHFPSAENLPLARYLRLAGRSLLLSAGVATIATIAAWPVARLIGARHWARRWGPLLLAIPLLIPPHVHWYCWSLPLAPSSPLGQFIGRSDQLLHWIATVRSVVVLCLWYAPLCGLIMGIGWRRTDPEAWAQSSMEASLLRRWMFVGLPMLRGAVAASWILTFAMTMSQFPVFHLAAIDTLGTELSVLYQLSYRSQTVAVAAIPLLVPAVLAAFTIDRFLRPSIQNYELRNNEVHWSGHWILATILWLLAAVIPVMLLALHLQGASSIKSFLPLSWDGLLSSFIIAALAALLAILIAAATLLLRGPLGYLMRLSTLLTALLPGSLIAAAIVITYNRSFSEPLYQSRWIVSMGHAAQLAVIALIVLRWAQASLPANLSELARLDGAANIRTAWQVYLPGLWPALGAALLLAGSRSLTELSATMVLLPPGIPNFAQHLLNQMHYARDQQVIVSCLMLIVTSTAAATAVFVAVTWLAQGRDGGTG